MRKKLLFFGSNFPVATRVADIFKREFDVIEYTFSATNECGQLEVFMPFNGTLLSNALAFHGAQYVVLTSESLLYIHSKEGLTGLLEELRSVKRLKDIHMSFVEISEPIVVTPDRRIQALQGNKDYDSKLASLRYSLVDVADYVLQVQSVYSPVADSWGINFLHHLFDANDNKPTEVLQTLGDWRAFSADEVAKALITCLGKKGGHRLVGAPYFGGLNTLCNAVTVEFSRFTQSQVLRALENTNQDFSNAHCKVAETDHDIRSATRQAHCSVNYLYRKSPEEKFGARSVARFRYELGAALAKSIPRESINNVDMVVSVPETGKIYAQGLANALALPYLEAIYKSDRKRSFDIESFDQRREFLYSRLNVIPDLLKGKSVMLVDEAIFTGATLVVVSHLLRAAGVNRIYIAIPSSEARYACEFNMQPKRNLLSEYVRREELWSYFNVQGVYFQDDVVFVQSVDQDQPNCFDCFIKKGLP